MATKRLLNNLFIEGSFKYGCIEVQDLADLSLLTANFLSSPNRLNILFQMHLEEPWKGNSHIAIHMFQLPNGQSEFDETQTWFGDERKTRARLPDGGPFEESTLAISHSPSDWMHTAYPRSCRDFVHVYSSAHQAILLRVKSKRGTVLDHPLLRIASERIRIVPNQWETGRPKVRIRKLEAKTESCTIVASQFGEILALSKRARDKLNIDEEAEGPLCAERIYDYIESARLGTSLTKKEASLLAVELGFLWGTNLLETGQWEWRTTTFAGEEEFLALFNKDGTHAIAPAVLINNILKSKRTTNNILLLYNMILGGNLPDLIDGQVVWLN